MSKEVHLNDISKAYINQVSNIKKAETEADIKRWEDLGGPTPGNYKPLDNSAKLNVEAKVDTGSAEEKATARNKRNTPAGANRKFDTSVFITRKPGESLDSARTRKRRDAHAAKRGVSEDRLNETLPLSARVKSVSKADMEKMAIDDHKAALKKLVDQSTRNRGDLTKRDAGAMGRERLRQKQNESFSDWREDLREVIDTPIAEKEAGKKVDEKKGIKNKVVINPKLGEAVEEIGGKVLKVEEQVAAGVALSPQELLIQKKKAMLDVRLAKKRRQSISTIDKDAVDVRQDDDKKKVEEGKLTSVKATTYGMPPEERKALIDAERKRQGVKPKPEKKIEEEVGISSTEKMADARKEAKLRAKEAAAVKKAKTDKQKAASRKKSISSKKHLTPSQLKQYDTDGDGKIRVVNASYDPLEDAVEYFYAEGITEEGIDLIVEDVGLEEFVNFVDFIHDETKFLNEERAARKMNVRTLKATKKKAEEIKADRSDVVGPSTPKDTVARARAERASKTPKLAKPAPKKEAPAPTKAKKAAVTVKKVVKSKKDYDGDGKKETPKQEHRGVRNKKITKAVAKAKPAQPKKPASKEGLRAKIKSAYEAGVKRHRKATQPVRVFHKGMKAGAKKAVKFAKDVKKVVSEGREDRDPPPQFEKGDDDRGNPDYMKSVSYADEKKWERLQRMRRASKKKEVRDKVNEGKIADALRKTIADMKAADRKAGLLPGGPDVVDLDVERERRRKKKVEESRDRAVDIVRANIIKKHGEGAIYDAKRDAPTEAQKKANAEARKKRAEADKKAFADRAKKAGYKNPQDYANVVARYGSEDNMKKGKGLGT